MTNEVMFNLIWICGILPVWVLAVLVLSCIKPAKHGLTPKKQFIIDFHNDPFDSVMICLIWFFIATLWPMDLIIACCMLPLYVISMFCNRTSLNFRENFLKYITKNKDEKSK